MQVTYQLENSDATEAFGRLLANYISPPFIMGLSGEIGMGKTCLTRALIQKKGVTSRIKSPSYTLLETYEIEDAELIHFDLYRMHSIYELEELGFRDYLHERSICFIEWPERAPMLRNLIDIVLEFSFTSSSQGRMLVLTANSVRGQNVLALLKRDLCLKK